MQPLRLSPPRVRNSAWALALGALALGALPWSAGTAEARIYPFAYLGGSTIQTVREEQDELLNIREIESWRQGWSIGGGIRLLATQEGGTVAERPRWEIRLGLGAVGGKLEDIQFGVTRTAPPIYEARTVETFEYSGWTLGGTALVRVLPQVGFFAGPRVQRIKLKGTRDTDWQGTIPDFCGSCGDFHGDAEANVVYGIFELGTRLETAQVPAAVELFWIPKRIQMSSGQTVGAGGYRATFADLSSSVGLRFIYDF